MCIGVCVSVPCKQILLPVHVLIGTALYYFVLLTAFECSSCTTTILLQNTCTCIFQANYMYTSKGKDNRLGWAEEWTNRKVGQEYSVCVCMPVLINTQFSSTG